MKNPQTKKHRTNRKSRGAPPNMSVGWGRGASEYRPGLFTKQYFAKHEEACCADIYRALSQEIERLNEERMAMDEKPIRRPNYSSFSRYTHWFVILGLIQRTDKRERAVYDFLQKRVFYRLTDRGKTEIRAWEDPVRAAHPEFG